MKTGGSSQASFWHQAAHDRLLRPVVPLLAAAQLPYTLAIFKNWELSGYIWLLTTVFLLPLSIWVLWPGRDDDFSPNENTFWKLLSLGFLFWWPNAYLRLVWPTGEWNASLELVTNSLLLGMYTCWVIALVYTPHSRQRESLERTDQQLMVSASIALAFFLFAYFVLVPYSATGGERSAWIPGNLVYFGLDCLITAIVLWLSVRVESRKWTWLYALLGTYFLISAGLDFLQAMGLNTRPGWVDRPVGDILWSLPTLVLVVFARARGFRYAEDDEVQKERDPSAMMQTFASVSPIVAASFILPVLHIGLNLLGGHRLTLMQPRGVIVLGSLIVFWILAFMENRRLRKVSQEFRDRAQELEQQRIRQQVDRKSADAKHQFLANVSHEIRTPMTGILGMTDMLLRGKLAAEQRTQAELVRSSAAGLLAVIDDILQYSRQEAGEFSLVSRPFDLKTVANEVFTSFQALARQKNLGLYMAFEQDMPLELIGDGPRLGQVLFNLVSNAIKFTFKGEISIRFSRVVSARDGLRIRCEVCDSGVGIKDLPSDELFLPFTQGDASASRKFEGSGLGLAICRQIVEAQSGTIGVDTGQARGVTFWFELPFEVPKAGFEAAGEADATALKKRVLLAEDDEVNQIVAVRQIEALGWQVDVANNGHEVLDALQNQDYALILMDCQMPELDGLEATRRIRAQGLSQQDMPIIAMTAHALEQDRDHCLEAGMNGFLSKPLLLDELSQTLDTWVNATSAPDVAPA